jgi:hypothetical protein
MAKLVLTNANVSIASVDVSQYVASVELSTTAADIETTSFGSDGNVTRTGGLKDASISLDFHQDYPALEALVYPLVGATATVVVRPNGTGTASSANPSYTAVVLVTEWNPVAGAVGELATASVSWPVTGGITKAVA